MELEHFRIPREQDYLNYWSYRLGWKVAKLKMVKTMADFLSYTQLRYLLPLQGLKFLNKEFDQYFQDVYNKYDRFDDTNSEELRKTASENYIDADKFNFDPKCIDWEDYYMRTNIPGLAKHVIS